MSKHQQLLFLQCLFFFTKLFHISYADIGTSAQYNPPYLPTQCYGNDVTQLPPNNMFASASEGVWDNGASCGRQYLVRCLSATVQGTCSIGDRTILVRIVDRAATSVSRPSSNGTTIVLSARAFALVANSSASTINIEFQQV